MESRVKAFRHPIHPMLIPFPLGLLATAVIFDLIQLVSGTGNVEENGPRECFAVLVDTLGGDPGVTRPDPASRRFGSSALKVHGSIYAMLTRDHLVVKLPRERVSQLIQDGTGSPFDAGRR